MHNTFHMPDVGEGLTEAQLLGWNVAVGDTVSVNQTLAEVETAKAVVELPSPYAGVVSHLHCEVGEVVLVGSPIITIADSVVAANVDVVEAQQVTAPKVHMIAQTDAAESSAEAATEEADARNPVLVGYGVSHTKAERRARKPGWSAGLSRSMLLLPDTPQRSYAKPPVRQLAKRLGVDLSGVLGSGDNGLITRADVLAMCTPVATNKAERIPLSGMRKHIADAMVASAFSAPHVTEWLEVDVTRALRLLNSIRRQREYAEMHITPLTLVARATVLSLQRNSEINATWDGANGEIIRHHDVNLGIAVASPRGLIVPNVQRAQTLSFSELARALSELITEARANRTPPSRMRGGTMTITNVGVFGVDGATPILNTGESAILAVGQIRQQPWNRKGKIKLRSVTTLALSFDHRVADGELGSGVLRDIARLLEHPAHAFAW